MVDRGKEILGFKICDCPSHLVAPTDVGFSPKIFDVAQSSFNECSNTIATLLIGQRVKVFLVNLFQSEVSYLFEPRPSSAVKAQYGGVLNMFVCRLSTFGLVSGQMRAVPIVPEGVVSITDVRGTLERSDSPPISASAFQ